jgi:hypothetical protein
MGRKKLTEEREMTEELDYEKIQNEWRGDIKEWLLINFNKIEPTQEEYEKTEKYLDSMGMAQRDIISFCNSAKCIHRPNLGK